jgi:MFS family permease
VTVFSVGSALCGAAPNMNALIVGRVIAGVGGAGVYLGLLNLISINTTIRERPAYMGGIGFTWGSGTILGPVIGGAFSDSTATWRWVGKSLTAPFRCANCVPEAFYINLIIFGALSPALLLIPNYQP